MNVACNVQGLIIFEVRRFLFSKLIGVRMDATSAESRRYKRWKTACSSFKKKWLCESGRLAPLMTKYAS